MKPVLCLYLLLIPVFVLAGCAPFSTKIQPTQEIQIPSPTNLLTPGTVSPTLIPTLAATETLLPTATQTLLATLDLKSLQETAQPLLRDPMSCPSPCFWGITPGITSMDEAKDFFQRMGFPHREGIDSKSGKDFYTVGYEVSNRRDSNFTLYTTDSLVESMVIRPEITKPKEGEPREWIAYSPETLIKKYGKPSRVRFAIDRGPNFVVAMIMYFDDYDLIALYSGYNMIPNRPRSPQLCPLTAPFDHVRLWMGPNPPDLPQFPTIPLEKATSFTIDQFTQLILEDPQNACFILNGDMFQ